MLWSKEESASAPHHRRRREILIGALIALMAPLFAIMNTCVSEQQRVPEGWLRFARPGHRVSRCVGFRSRGLFHEAVSKIKWAKGYSAGFKADNIGGTEMANDNGWGGAREGSGAPPRTLLQHVEGCSYRPTRHESLLLTDDSLLLLAARSDDERLQAAAGAQTAYRETAATREYWGGIFARLARGRRGWKASATKVRKQAAP